MSGMTGASMLRTRRKDVNLKPNRKLDRKSSRGMLYENEELRLRTININAEVERGQSDIKKLKRENEQLKREISALRYEYDRLDKMLRERRSSPEQSDDAVSVCSKASKCPERKSKSNFGIVTMTNYNDSVSICSACPECTSETHSRTVAFHDLSVVPEVEEEGNRSLGVVQEVEEESIESGVESPCNCDECQNEFQSQPKTNNNPSKPIIPKNVTQPQNNGRAQPNMADNIQERSVDVLVHDSSNVPNFFQSVTTPYHVAGPPPPGFVIAPCEPPRFHTGGNIDDLLGDVQSCPNSIQTTFIQQNSIFMCNMKRIMQKQCCCHKNESPPQPDIPPEPTPKCYVTEKNIELTYDYPRATPIPSSPSQKTSSEMQSTTTEVASTVVFVERRIPVKPKKFDFFFRSRSAPVGENEEPIYATVNKLPKRLRRMELANLEKEVAYKTTEPDSSSRTEVTKTDSESQVPPPDDDTSRSEREKSTVPTRPDSPKAKKRKRFSLTFKKRERKRREKKEAKNGAAKNGGVTTHHHTDDNERLIEGEVQEPKHKHCIKHRPRNTLSSASSGPRYKRDSYQEMTTSHSEHERTNSVCSSVNSLASACTHKSRKLSVAPQDGSIPWCGCWGAGCV